MENQEVKFLKGFIKSLEQTRDIKALNFDNEKDIENKIKSYNVVINDYKNLLEKEVARLEKSIAVKKDKIEELAKDL